MNPIILTAMRRFWDRAKIEAVYQEAFQAAVERRIEVVITSASFEGGSSNGVLRGDPTEIMAACERILNEMDGKDVTERAGINFSTRYVST